MTTQSPARPLRLRTTSTPAARRQNVADDQLLAKIGSAGLQAALAMLLSIFGLGSAMGQSVDQDMAYGANTQATRDRVIAEIRQARNDGAIRRWSPVLVDFPFDTPLKGHRFEPYATRRVEAAPVQFSHGDASASPAIQVPAPRAAQ